MGDDETPKVGKTFGETFSFLKKTDLYELPPQPKEEVKAKTSKNANAILINSKQRGNPVIKHIRNVPWEYSEIIPDYEMGQTTCALFLSLRYHNLNPDYIHERLKLLGNRYNLRVLLVLVDLVNSKSSLKELCNMCILADLTLILAWSAEEAGRYLETYKAYEFKPPDIIQQRIQTDFTAKMQDVLTTVKSVNKTDALTLFSAFGSFKNIVNATQAEISICPGFGNHKAQRLNNALKESFKRTNHLAQSNTETVEVQQKTSSNENNITTKIIKPLTENDKKDKSKAENKVKEKQVNNGSVDLVSPKKVLKLPKESVSPMISKTQAISQSGLSRTMLNKNKLTEASDLSKQFAEGSGMSPVKLAGRPVKLNASPVKPGASTVKRTTARIKIPNKPTTSKHFDNRSNSNGEKVSKIITNASIQKTPSNFTITNKTLKTGGESVTTTEPIAAKTVSKTTEINDDEYADLLADDDSNDGLDY